MSSYDFTPPTDGNLAGVDTNIWFGDDNDNNMTSYTFPSIGDYYQYGGGGNDVIELGLREKLDVVVDGAEMPDPKSQGGSLYGEAGDDRLFGTFRSDLLYGGTGMDVIGGEAGHDTAFGGANDDWIDGSNDNDTLKGEEGNDHLFGGEGVDYLVGGIGNDILYGDTTTVGAVKVENGGFVFKVVDYYPVYSTLHRYIKQGKYPMDWATHESFGDEGYGE